MSFRPVSVTKALYTLLIHFFRKLASAVSGSLSSFVLGFIGYNVAEGAVQTAEVSNAIWKSLHRHLCAGLWCRGCNFVLCLSADKGKKRPKCWSS